MELIQARRKPLRVHLLDLRSESPLWELVLELGKKLARDHGCFIPLSSLWKPRGGLSKPSWSFLERHPRQLNLGEPAPDIIQATSREVLLRTDLSFRRSALGASSCPTRAFTHFPFCLKGRNPRWNAQSNWRPISRPSFTNHLPPFRRQRQAPLQSWSCGCAPPLPLPAEAQ